MKKRKKVSQKFTEPKMYQHIWIKNIEKWNFNHFRKFSNIKTCYSNFEMKYVETV